MKVYFGLIFILWSGIASARYTPNEGSDILDLSQMTGVTLASEVTDSCIPQELLVFIDELRTRFGEIEVISSFRTIKHNREVGGAKKSQHLTCDAIDFRIPNVPRKEVKLFLTANFKERAGIGYYCGGSYHLDIGKPRQWGRCQPTKREERLAKARYPQLQLAQERSQAVETHNHIIDPHDGIPETVIQ